MSSPHLFAHCSEALCIAEDTAVSFYAPRTLKKFRVERFNGARICGTYIQQGSDGKGVLHVVDVEGTWFVLSLHQITLVSSYSIRLGKGADVDVKAGTKPVISSRGRALRGGENGAGALSVQEAHFHETGGALRCVILTLTGVYEVLMENNATSVMADAVVHFPSAMKDCVLAVGIHSGVVVVGQRGQRWIQYVHLHEREKARLASLPSRRLVLPVALQSVACNPHSDAVAVGGSRGELLVYPSIGRDAHYFSDHWHHTPLTALSFSIDGASLITGAAESVLLVWTLSSYTHRKIYCNLGPIRCAVPSRSTGSTLILACADNTIASVDLLQMRLEVSVEGVEWAAGEACSGLIVDLWMGQPAVVLTGLPNVLRICDPFTQQAIYSLHISSQMETIPTPPRHGIRFAGMLQENRVLVTYESFSTCVLPSLLRFWVYDAVSRRHIESQTIYSPHSSEVIALQVNKVSGCVFTLSRDSIKCWEEVREDANDTFATGKRNWRNVSTSTTPSQQVSTMSLSDDGSLCFVADDSVHVYSVDNCKPGERWPLLLTFTQGYDTQPLQDIRMLPASKTLVARDEHRVYLWNLAEPHMGAQVYHADSDERFTSLCIFSSTTILVATSGRVLIELSGDPTHLGAVLGKVPEATSHPLLYMEQLPNQDNRVAVVDSVTGFRVLHVILKEHRATEERYVGSPIHQDRNNGMRPLGQYFTDASRWGDGPQDDEQLSDAIRYTRANHWLLDILKDPAYTAPPMSTVLSEYLKKRSSVSGVSTAR